MNAFAASWLVSNRGFPTPWQITGGPRLAETIVDGRAWVFTLARGGRERQLTVVLTRQALTIDPPGLLPVQTREAIQTDGRSEAARVAQFDDPTTCVVLGREGYLPAPVRLARAGRPTPQNVDCRLALQRPTARVAGHRSGEAPSRS